MTNGIHSASSTKTLQLSSLDSASLGATEEDGAEEGATSTAEGVVEEAGVGLDEGVVEEVISEEVREEEAEEEGLTKSMRYLRRVPEGSGEVYPPSKLVNSLGFVSNVRVVIHLTRILSYA